MPRVDIEFIHEALNYDPLLSYFERIFGEELGPDIYAEFIGPSREKIGSWKDLIGATFYHHRHGACVVSEVGRASTSGVNRGLPLMAMRNGRSLYPTPNGDMWHHVEITEESENSLLEVQETRASLREQFRPFIREKYAVHATARHKQRMKDLGRRYSGVADVAEKGEGRRVRKTQCYDCKKPLETGFFLECSACAWMICICGACGCGYWS